MPSTMNYTVKKGDSLAKIAESNFISNWKKEIWSAPFNKELRTKTKDPDNIQPGWVVKIPVIKMPARQTYAAVGTGKALNRPEDVQTVKAMLNQHAETAGFKPLQVHGKADRSFIDAIKSFQAASGQSANGIVAPKDKTILALGKKPTKNKEPAKTIYKIGGKEYQADANDVKIANKKISKRLLDGVVIVESGCNDLVEQHNEIAQSWGNGAPWIRAALRLSGNSNLIKVSADKIRKAQAEIKKFRSLANSTDSATLKKAAEQRLVVQKSLNVAGGGFTDMIHAAGSTMDVWIDVLIFTRDTSFGIIEVYLALVTKNPPAAGAAVGSFKQGIEELANAAFLNDKWKASGGLSGSVCRVTVKGAEGAVLGKIGQWVGKAAAPFASKMGTWISKSGLLSKVMKSQSKTIREIVLKKYSKELMQKFPNLVQKDIADWMIESALDTTWNAGASHVAGYWINWLKDYHYKLCDMIVKDEASFAAAMKRAESAARTQTAAEPLILQHIEMNKDKIAKLVVESMNTAAKR